jgi:DNA-binding transcriptional MerR regulator
MPSGSMKKRGCCRARRGRRGGYRLYHEREVADLEFIQKAQQLEFSLNEIRELFSIQRHPDEACAHVRDLIAAKLGVVRTKIADLQRLETDLAEALRQCRTALRKPSKLPRLLPGSERNQHGSTAKEERMRVRDFLFFRVSEPRPGRRLCAPGADGRGHGGRNG